MQGIVILFTFVATLIKEFASAINYSIMGRFGVTEILVI
jgi:hypothetical protein